MTANVLDGKRALVTGASRGIGRAIALALAGAGAEVAVNYHQPAEAEHGHDNAADAEAVAAGIRGSGRKSVAVAADVSVKSEVTTMTARVVAEFGGLDILVNNAGICPFHTALDMPEELWDRVQQVNLKGTFLCSQAAGQVMVEQGTGGRIISMSSISALVGGELQAHYTSTKAAIHSFMQSLAISLGPHGITCNSVLPGAILTDMNAEDLADNDKMAAFERRIPLGRVGRPEDIADPVVFLASDAARYVTGAGLLIDGGMFVNLQ